MPAMDQLVEKFQRALLDVDQVAAQAVLAEADFIGDLRPLQAAVLAVMLGVALALSVHLINASALSEFSQAVRSVNGQPDLTLRAAQGQFDESL